MQFRPYTLTTIASTGDRFTDFAPYVASINDAGVVAFQATLAGGHSGVFTGGGGPITDIAVTTSAACPVQRFTSHPDINRAGALTVYGTLDTGEQALLMFTDGHLAAAGGRDRFTTIGPLGPTMNEHGEVAFRGALRDGQAGIHLQRGAEAITIATAGPGYRGFEGLPVVNNLGQLVFRADLPDGRQGLFMHQQGQCSAIATTGDDFTELARFPIVNDHGTVAFAAVRKTGGPALFTATAGRLTCLVDAAAGFESFRGVLINNAGPVAFYATPAAGQIGIYTGPDPLHHRVVGVGDALLGATVTDFALNPVSVNELGQLAIRVALSDGRQFILRGDPGG
ncbi:choice-of-anchor tandem repeat NxxGxxAF-containing protein [Ideonella sp.]|uniref:DUF7453 family protein n=1 Tax=Ideonella sp. TaxID=1929293 RepID=UPI0035AD8928